MNKLQIEGKVIAVMPVISGTSKAGNQWSKQEFVIETMDQYPRKVCMQLMGDKIDRFANLIQESNILEIDFDVESREYNGRYYTNVSAYDMRHLGSVVTAAESPFLQQPSEMDRQADAYFGNCPAPHSTGLNPEQQKGEGDLPF